MPGAEVCRNILYADQVYLRTLQPVYHVAPWFGKIFLWKTTQIHAVKTHKPYRGSLSLSIKTSLSVDIFLNCSLRFITTEVQQLKHHQTAGFGRPINPFNNLRLPNNKVYKLFEALHDFGKTVECSEFPAQACFQLWSRNVFIYMQLKINILHIWMQKALFYR